MTDSDPNGRLWIVIDDRAHRVESLRRAPNLPPDRLFRKTPRLLVEGQWWRMSEKDADATLPLIDNDRVCLVVTARDKPHVAIAHTRAFKDGKGRRESINWSHYALTVVRFSIEYNDPDGTEKIREMFLKYSPTHTGQN